ncbi:site-specific integrase [Rhizobium cremeum]|nr:site-specific integrase [Rhizobium cremeum]MCJ8002243.1 site-specific integrase [Rhizobium cremeum]
MVCSLGSCDAKTARLLSDRLYAKSENLFELARQNPMLSDDQLARLVQDFYALVLRQEKSIRANGRVVSEEQRVARAGYWRHMAEEIRKALGANRLHDGSWTAIEAARLQGLKWPDLAIEERHQCAEAVHRAGIDLSNALAARYEGDFNFEPKDKLLTRALRDDVVVPTTPSRPKTEPAVPGTLPLSDIYLDFIKRQVDRKDWRQQMAAQAKATYRLFIAICGDRPIPDYRRTDAATFRKTIERMPYDYGKAAIYKGLNPFEIIEKFEATPPNEKSERLTQKTVKRHFAALSKLWSEALADGDVSENLFTGFKFSTAKRAIDERAMWNADELETLFSSPVWTGCLNSRQRQEKGDKIIRDEKFWVPLITLLSGMRLEEICQLQTDDIREEDGIAYFDLNDRPPRQLKNKNAVRKVPIHSELIRLGFLRYAEGFGERSHSLFPQLKPGGADNKFGHAFSKWFTRYRQQIGVYKKNLDFHSLRHTATTCMHRADVNTMVIDHLTGHSTPGETARYTKGSALSQLAAAVETIRPPLDFRKLYDQKLLET